MVSKNQNIKVAVAMSGGVDSSVSAGLLVKQGYEVIGITMKTYDFMEVGGKPIGETNCCDPNSIQVARNVADSLGIKHYVINLRDEFNDLIIQDFIQEYMAGRTPNPCVLCNKFIKFGILLEKAKKLGMDYIATGHYARIRKDLNTGRYVVSRGKDLNKDQSYMLWAVSQESLSSVMFPIGEMTKDEVRKVAEEMGLVNALKRESYELCFIPDNNYKRFLTERVPDLVSSLQEGKVIWDGKEVGTHEGYLFYTIGQRKGFGAYGKKMYVTGIDSGKNTVYIGDDKDLYKSALIAREVNWVKMVGINGVIRGKAKIRYKDDLDDATVSLINGNKILVKFDKPKRAITPGQSVVVYDGDDLVCGGIIENYLHN